MKLKGHDIFLKARHNDKREFQELRGAIEEDREQMLNSTQNHFRIESVKKQIYI